MLFALGLQSILQRHGRDARSGRLLCLHGVPCVGLYPVSSLLFEESPSLGTRDIGPQFPLLDEGILSLSQKKDVALAKQMVFLSYLPRRENVAFAKQIALLPYLLGSGDI